MALEKCAEAYAALARQLTSDRSVTLYSAMASHIVDATTGGVIFLTGISLAQCGQKLLGIGAATPVLPKCIGACAIAASSAVALHFASLPLEIYEDVVATHTPATDAHQWSVWHPFGSTSAGSVNNNTPTWQQVQQKLQVRAADLADAPYPVYMFMGLVCFKILGGRTTSIAPSHFANLGAFHLKKASLPATADYATSIERGVIQEFGRLFGCHTCGIKRGVRYHADHMPPKLVAKRRDSGLVRRLIGRKTTFRFYPQCEPCSNQQGSVVKQWQSTLKLHLSSLRLYHLTGFWLVLLCTGGLYVGGSSYHDSFDTAPTQHATRNIDANHNDIEAGSSSLESSLLTSLRERERKLRRDKRSMKDAAQIAAINKEIDAILKCKLALKTNIKQQKAN